MLYSDDDWAAMIGRVPCNACLADMGCVNNCAFIEAANDERAARMAAEAESESRRVALVAVGEERAAEWRRAEAAEARVAELEAMVAEAVPHIDEWNFPLTLGQRMRDAVKHLPEGEDA